MKKILFVIMAMAVLDSAFGLARTESVGADPRVRPHDAKIQIVTQDVDIGEVPKGGIFNYVIEVKNIGGQDLIIENVYASCGCLEVSDKRWPSANVAAELALPRIAASGKASFAATHVVIEPKKSTSISVKLNTNKVSGVFEKMLHIISNDPENKDVMWKIKGVVAAELALPLLVTHEANQGLQLQNTNVAAELALPIRSKTDAKTVMVFYSPGCDDCREIMEKFLPEIKEKYGEKISIVYYDIDRPEAFALLLDLINKYDKRSKKGFFNPRPPVVVVKDRLLYGVRAIKKNLESFIK